MIAKQTETWEIIPTNKMFNLRLKEVWAYRDLLGLLVRRDFVSFYKQTILGPLWFFIQPIFTTITFSFLSELGNISSDGLPRPLFILAGVTSWNYFADCLTKTSTVFKDNASIFGKVYFPRLIMPLSIVASNLVRFSVQMILFLLVMAYCYFVRGDHFHISWAISLFPVLILLMAMLGLGTGMIISAMTTKYRDLAFLVGFGVQLLMYATTVIYPLSTIFEKFPSISWLIKYNPLTTLIETFRFGFLGKGHFSWTNLSITTLLTFIILLIGIMIFNKVEKTFVDTV